jgi:hypothetical protein
MAECKKCGGTGYLPNFARVDAGRCWACLPAAPVPTAEQLADDEAARAEMGFGLTLADRVTRRRKER